jgi:F0F1-type ATP synthase membrane subunit b/b'
MPPLESGIESRHRLVLRALAEAKKLMEDLQLARAAGPTGKMKVRLLHARQL